MHPGRTLAIQPFYPIPLETLSHMSSWHNCVRASLVFACSLFSISTFAQLQSDQIALSSNLLDGGSKGKVTTIAPHVHFANGQAHARQGVPFIDSLVNWNDHYFAPGYLSDGSSNNHWYTNVVGNPPNNHGTTYINAPIIPVDIDLRNSDGSIRYLNGKRMYLE